MTHLMGWSLGVRESFALTRTRTSRLITPNALVVKI